MRRLTVDRGLWKAPSCPDKAARLQIRPHASDSATAGFQPNNVFDVRKQSLRLDTTVL
jgi:hypothetical protein